MKNFCSIFCSILFAATTLFAQETPTGKFLNLFTEDVQPKAISENGEWACGAALVESATFGYSNVVKWNLKTGTTIYLQESETDMCDAYWISNDGTLVGGSYLSQPAYNLNGKWIALDWPFVDLEGSQKSGEVVSIYFSGNDTICMGWIYTQTHAVLARWVNGTPDDDFSDVELDKYHNTTRINNQPTSFHKLLAVSNDGSRILASLDWIYIPVPGSQLYITTFVQNGDKVQIIEREFDDRYKATSFVDNAVMSPNGKWVCGYIYAFAKAESGLTDTHIAFLYDVDNDQLTTFPQLPNGKMTAATAVDNNGNVYFRSVNGTNPLCKPYLYKNNEYVELEKCLLAFKGILESDIDAIITNEENPDEDDLGHVWAVSADGNTLIGAGGATKGNIWVAKLNCSPYVIPNEMLDSDINNEDPKEEHELYELYVGSENPSMGGVKVILVAEPIEGFEFVEWTDGNTDNPRILRLTEDTEIYARFRISKNTEVNIETSKIQSANVYTNNGILHVEGIERDYYVLDAAGRLIYSGRDAEVRLPRGVYMVSVGGEVQKVVL